MSTKKKGTVGSYPTIGPNDVLLGRGNHLHNSGNGIFRNLVHSRSREYWSCNDTGMKHCIALQIVDSVTSQQGRFLRRVKISSRGTNPGALLPFSDLNVSVPAELWEVADTETVLVKIKQTFRDFTASKKKREGASSCKKNPRATAEGIQNLQQVSILERLQNYNNQTSSPFIAIPDTSTRSRTFSSVGMPENDAYEMLFQNARVSQLDHLVHQAQQQLRNKDNQDQQLLSLFEQQRAILMTQLEQSGRATEKKTQVNRAFPQQQVSDGQGSAHRQLSTLPAQTLLHHESTRLPTPELQLQTTLPTQQLYQSHQDRFVQGHNDQPYFINQQLQVISRLTGAASYQPQFTWTNQNIQQNQILSSMKLNDASNMQNLSLQPMLHNNSPLYAALQPLTQDQYGPTADQYSIAERFNEFLTQRSNFPSVTNMTNMSSNRSINELFAFSGQTQLPETIPYPHPLLEQTATTDYINQSAFNCDGDVDENKDDDKKPPAL